MPPAPSWYAGKMLEMRRHRALPKGTTACSTSVDRDGVSVLEAMNPIRFCSPFSVANHSLHENATPCFHVEPGGLLDTSEVPLRCRQRSRRARLGHDVAEESVHGKLEGAELAGYRAITICGTRDPLLISTVGEFLESVRENVRVKATRSGSRLTNTRW
jgi:hypothetical protein